MTYLLDVNTLLAPAWPTLVEVEDLFGWPILSAPFAERMGRSALRAHPIFHPRLREAKISSQLSVSQANGVRRPSRRFIIKSLNSWNGPPPAQPRACLPATSVIRGRAYLAPSMARMGCAFSSVIVCQFEPTGSPGRGRGPPTFSAPIASRHTPARNTSPGGQYKLACHKKRENADLS
jgi:hypothetical protein